MSTNTLHSKPVTWFLAVALVAIWGAIFYNIYDSISTGDSDVESVVGPASPQKISGERFVYTDDVRDPFRRTPLVERKMEPRPAITVPAWVPPPLRLSGILVSGKKHTAIVERGDGSTLFMKEGDTLSGVKILKITPAAVEYIFNKKKAEWALENK